MEVLEETASDDVWNFVWQTFANASLTYDLVSSQNGTNGSIDENAWVDNPAKLGILTGFLIACIADFRIATPKFPFDAGLDSRLKTLALTLINIFSFIILAPIISVFLIVFYAYRRIVEIVLRMELRDEFAGLLEGTDCVWALEESTALSVINVLGVLQKDDSTTNGDFLLDFRKLINDRLVTSSFDKLNWLREKKYGYYYWRRSDGAVKIEERVRWIDEVEDSADCDESHADIQEDILKTTFAEVSNKLLPRKHSASWEILIGKTCVESAIGGPEEMDKSPVGPDYGRIGGKKTIPLLFRVHHSLGDGVALLRLMLESIADPDSIKVEEDSINVSATMIGEAETETKKNPSIKVPLLRASTSILGSLRDEREIVYYDNDLLSASMPFSTGLPLWTTVKSIFSRITENWEMLECLKIEDMRRDIGNRLGESWKIFKIRYLNSFLKTMIKLEKFSVAVISIPSCLVLQAIRSMDNNALHGPVLTGKKLVSCWIESESSSLQHCNLLSKIRDIKNATGTRFGNVVLTALSANLHRYFNKIGEPSPKNMTVVIPARMTMPTKKLSLQNGFSVGLLTLCVSEVNGESVEFDFPEDSRLLERLGDIFRRSDKLRNDPDYLVNYWVMKFLSAALPERILRLVLESHSTMVFSNLPGPQQVSILGRKLKNVAFWIPHRGKTGVGCSLLTYGGKVHVTLVADAALVKSQRMLDEILRDTVEDIETLYETVSLSCFSKNLRDRSDAPTETGFGVH